MTEFEETVLLANQMLERPYGDPDDDLAMLSRQFLRQLERLPRIERAYALLDSLLAGDRLRPEVYGSAEQELSILVMRDALGWVLGRGHGAINIDKNLEALAGLAAKVKASKDRPE